MKRPKSAFGVSWGDPFEQAMRTLGVACEQRYAWHEKSGFQICRGQASLVETEAWIEIVTRDDRVEGLFATFTGVACDALEAKLREVLGVPRSIESIAVSWRSGEVIRLEETAAGCRLVVAGPRLGAEIQKDQLARAFQEFAGGSRP